MVVPLIPGHEIISMLIVCVSAGVIIDFIIICAIIRLFQWHHNKVGF